jgi:hypothetical protein
MGRKVKGERWKAEGKRWKVEGIRLMALDAGLKAHGTVIVVG